VNRGSRCRRQAPKVCGRQAPKLTAATNLVQIAQVGGQNGSYMKRELNENLSDNEVYNTNYLILLAKKMMCIKLHSHKGVNSIFFPCKIVRLATGLTPEALGVRGRGGGQGSGFRVQGSGFRVQGSGFRVQGSRSRDQGSGFRVQGSGEVTNAQANTGRDRKTNIQEEAKVVHVWEGVTLQWQQWMWELFITPFKVYM